MKITASVTSKLGDRTLERGKTYDIKKDEAKYLLRAGLGREASKGAEVEETVKKAALDTPKGAKPGEDSAPTETTSTSTGASTPTTKKAGK